MFGIISNIFINPGHGESCWRSETVQILLLNTSIELIMLNIKRCCRTGKLGTSQEQFSRLIRKKLVKLYLVNLSVATFQRAPLFLSLQRATTRPHLIANLQSSASPCQRAHNNYSVQTFEPTSSAKLRFTGRCSFKLEVTV